MSDCKSFRCCSDIKTQHPVVVMYVIPSSECIEVIGASPTVIMSTEKKYCRGWTDDDDVSSVCDDVNQECSMGGAPPLLAINGQGYTVHVSSASGQAPEDGRRVQIKVSAQAHPSQWNSIRLVVFNCITLTAATLTSHTSNEHIVNFTQELCKCQDLGAPIRSF